ncbi:Uncharacterized protein PECH_000445 [Penicillium ucsense]|uniref:Sister chromatid cohesion protein Dcc1 n=1 Tax=Penicillium ucsense TaxID=2839758 RepID=A0A8J8WIN9_9EURO|nr:Uncharacterized protein PECM_007213 [Penicillium ucsense]KAF7733602.1 Uncharacterized protein PECH_000445 [Penicillium ucsense]
MATQASQSILFTNTQPQQGFRLLELTPELEELLSSKDAPRLQIKSPSLALARAVLDPSALEYVNLCTPTRTYRIRQVQSSNSLHILQPSLGRISKEDIKVVGGSDGANEESLNLVDGTVAAIAKCGSTLELHTPQDGFSAVPFLEKSLALFDRRVGDGDRDLDVDMLGDESGDADATVLRERVFADVPVSSGQCEAGWMEICAFADERRRHCWRPSARMRLGIWKRVVEGATLQGIDLNKQFLVRDLWKSVLDDDDDDESEDDGVNALFPRALFEAVVRRVSVVEERPPLSAELKWASLDKIECARWVGETYLAATAPTPTAAIGRSEFINAWRDCLPEAWREEVALSKLPVGSYQNPDPTTIYYVEPSQRLQASKGSASAPAAAATVKSTRNWHELLKNPKRR